MKTYFILANSADADEMPEMPFFFSGKAFQHA